MKYLIAYFSATGNTKRIVDLYKNEMLSHNDEVILFNIDNNELDFDINEFDALFIAYPIHGFNAPKNVVKFAKKIAKPLFNKRLIILKCSGEPAKPNNVSSLKMLHYLKKKNFKLTNEYHYVLPYNIMFHHTPSEAYKMLEICKGLIPLDYVDIINNKEHYLSKVFMPHFFAWFMRIEHWGAEFNGLFYSVNKKKCIKCMKCVNSCPTNNIHYNKDKNKFSFSSHCLLCQRCAFLCSKDAIRIGLLNGFRINGAYNFKKPEVESPKRKNDWYCKKSYNKYYKEAELRIENSKNN